MQLFGHHIGVEFFGHEFSPETPMEHVVAFGIVGVLLALTVYGAYEALRDPDKAFQWLFMACEQRSSGMTYLKVDPRFDNLRPDARYRPAKKTRQRSHPQRRSDSKQR